MDEYKPREIEMKWQKTWEDAGLFKADDKSKREKKYVLDMFPYPSGDGLHVGHVKIYTASDVLSRYLRMKGYEVLHPMGWDAFGLPTENTAIKQGVHPADLTKKNVDRFRKQMKMVGLSYDWDREVNTTDPEYYKWTQWIFLQLYKRGLAYQDLIAINWCPSCKTGLANEEVIDGNCERCGTKVIQKMLKQWMLKITKYADRLLNGVNNLDWPSFIKEMQTNWIGRSEGVNFKQKVKDLGIEFEVYDSIPQTFMAQTFTVIAPEHPMVEKLVEGTENEEKVKEFVEKIRQKKMSGKFDIETDMEGIFTGRFVDNPFGTGDLPIWVASFVLADYGTGIVNCSAHDERDFEFAKKYDIPLKIALLPENSEQAKRVNNLEEFYRETDGIMQYPDEVKGKTWQESREPVIEYIEGNKLGKKATNYKLRDWVFSRQRYWGEPIPIIHCEKCGIVPVPEKDLPVELPNVEKYEPTDAGESPLAAMHDWVNVNCPKCDGEATRETDTMPQWAGSSWYWIRYLDSANSTELADEKKMEEWLPVDWYVGGAEHAVLHLLYARFWNMVLFDEKIVPNEEPFTKLELVGLLLGTNGQKMSKSRGNVISPDDVVEKHGADAVRVYEMFMGPFGNSMPWSDESLAGSARFINRVWKFVNSQLESLNIDSDSEDVNIKIHQTIGRVADGTEKFKFNTSIAALMELLNVLEEEGQASKKALDTLILLLAPYAPHIAEELWQKLGHSESVMNATWPEVDKKILDKGAIKIAVQVNGKLRGELSILGGISQDEVVDKGRNIEKVADYLKNGEEIKVIYVKDRILNFVIRE